MSHSRNVFGFSHVSGHPDEFPIDHRIFNAATLCSTLIAAIYAFITLFNPAAYAIDKVVIFGNLILYIVLYYFSRVKKIRHTGLRIIYFVITFSGLIYAFTTTGGIIGMAPYYFLLNYMIYLTIFRMRYHIILSSIIFITLLSTGIYQINNTSAFNNIYVIEPILIKNQLIAICVTFFFALGIVNYLRQNYSIERRKVLKVNKELALSEKEAQTAKNEAIQASQAKAEFLSTMSHEIRTPMNAVIGMTHLLMQESPRPDQKENLNILKFSAESLLALINDILDFSKIEAGKIVFEKVDFSIKELTRSVKEALAVKANDKGLELKVNIDKHLPDTVKADPTRLTQILNNLVGNAVKFTKTGSVSIDLTMISSNVQNAKILFKVIDTGIGISEDQQARIFEKFSQASSSTTREFGGTGLGLSITKMLLDLQGSEIKVESELGKGTTFSFELELEIGSVIHENKLVNLNRDLFSSLSGLRILVADDNKTNILIAKKFLSKWDAKVTAVNNGLQALNEAKSGNQDLILMDLQMPEMDGATATEEIRKLDDPIISTMPIIALTASAMLEEQDRIYKSGMNDFVSKPFNPSDLYKKIVQHSKLRTKAA